MNEEKFNVYATIEEMRAAQENAKMVEMERQDDTVPLTNGHDYGLPEYSLHALATNFQEDKPVNLEQLQKCPESLWFGKFAEIADRLPNGRTWDTWAAIYAALSARVHRNLHWLYFRAPIYGMSYTLLINRTGGGKSLVTDLCEELLGPDYNISHGIASGQALLNILTTEETKNPTGRLEVTGAPTLLALNEWTQLVKFSGIESSTLAEDVNQLHQRRRSWSIGRSNKNANGGHISIQNPSLSILGTTTPELFRALVKKQDLTSGFLNRYLVLPGQAEWQPYTGESSDMGSVCGAIDDLRGKGWGGGRELREAYDDEAWGHFRNLQLLWLTPLRRNTEDGATAFARIDVHFHHLALLLALQDASAWQAGVPFIRRRHVDAAHRVTTTSTTYLWYLLNEFDLQPPMSQERTYSLYLRTTVREKIRLNPGMTERQVKKSLWRLAPPQELSQILVELKRHGELREERRQGQKTTGLFVND